MDISEFASRQGRMVVIYGVGNRWYAAIQKTGFTCGFVEHTVMGYTPQQALDNLCAAFSGETLILDGNTDHKREIVAPYLEPY